MAVIVCITIVAKETYIG